MPKITSPESKLRLTLPDVDATGKLGVDLASSVSILNPGILLLYGELGAGKTTLTRFLVNSLPGGDEAEVTSPSFTIANIYYTTPRVHHFDLYRLETGALDFALEESFDDHLVLTVVEWSERLSPADMPEDGVNCHLFRQEDRLAAEISGIGQNGKRFIELLKSITKFIF